MTYSECTAIAKVFTLYELTRAQLTAKSDKELRANAAAIARLEQSKPNASTADLDKVTAMLFPGQITDHPAFRRLLGPAPTAEPRPASPPPPPPPAKSDPPLTTSGTVRPPSPPTLQSPAAKPPPASPSRPAAPPQQPLPNTPLSATELSTLARLLPQCNPKRFLTKHTPARWREVLARLVASPP